MAQPMIDMQLCHEGSASQALSETSSAQQEEGGNVRRRHQLAIHAHNYYNVCTI